MSAFSSIARAAEHSDASGATDAEADGKEVIKSFRSPS